MQFQKFEHNYNSVKKRFELQIFVRNDMTKKIMRYIKQHVKFTFVQILNYIRKKNFNTSIQIQNVYNVKKKFKYKKLKRYISTQLLLKVLHRDV